MNGAPLNFIVDTGATYVSLGRSDALKAGVDFTKGEPAMLQTANGLIRAWRVSLDSVRVGEITLRNVDGIVQANDMPIALLGTKVSLDDIERRLGQHIAGVAKDGGGIEWSLGRKRELSL